MLLLLLEVSKDTIFITHMNQFRTCRVQKSWRVVLEELFDTNGKVNILHMAFKHFDNKQSGKINYSQVIEATHKVLGPASRLRMFDGADFSGCLPRDDPALEKKGNIFNVQQFITIVFKSLTRSQYCCSLVIYLFIRWLLLFIYSLLLLLFFVVMVVMVLGCCLQRCRGCFSRTTKVSTGQRFRS